MEGRAIMRRCLLCLILLCTCSSHAQTLHKCSGRGGSIAYRDGDCLPGERLVAVRDAAIAASPQPQRRPERSTHAPRASREPAARDHRHERRRGTRGRTKRPKARKDPCSAAKQARDDFRRKQGTRVTMDQLSRWSHRVYDACK